MRGDIWRRVEREEGCHFCKILDHPIWHWHRFLGILGPLGLTSDPNL
jgi:hypothetical protein